MPIMPLGGRCWKIISLRKKQLPGYATRWQDQDIIYKLLSCENSQKFAELRD